MVDTIPKTQRAALSYGKDSPTVVETIPVVQPEALEPGQALVKILYSGVCHVRR
jgi:propanol-preferring alcohol dehydrogenase